MNRTHTIPVLLITATFALNCAPRVSKRAPSPATSAKLAEVEESDDEESAPVAVERAPAAPVVVAAAPAANFVSTQAEPAPVVKLAPPPPAAEEPKVVKPASRDHFYSFSDQEIASLRTKSRDFKKLHDRHQQCTKRSESNIARRDQLRDDINRLKYGDEHSAKSDKKLAKLLAEQAKLKKDEDGDLKTCREVESKMTEMLKSAYGGGEAGRTRARP